MTAPRRLVVEISAQARNWSLPVVGIERIVEAAPAGWTVEILEEAMPYHTDAGHIVTAGALAAAPTMEAYLGWGISEALFAAAPRLRWVHSAAAGVGRSPSRRQASSTSQAGMR